MRSSSGGTGTFIQKSLGNDQPVPLAAEQSHWATQPLSRLLPWMAQRVALCTSHQGPKTAKNTSSMGENIQSCDATAVSLHFQKKGEGCSSSKWSHSSSLLSFTGEGVVFFSWDLWYHHCWRPPRGRSLSSKYLAFSALEDVQAASPIRAANYQLRPQAVGANSAWNMWIWCNVGRNLVQKPRSYQCGHVFFGWKFSAQDHQLRPTSSAS